MIIQSIILLILILYRLCAPSRSATGYKGVYLTPGGTYQARLVVGDNLNKHLGTRTHATPELAALKVAREKQTIAAEEECKRLEYKLKDGGVHVLDEDEQVYRDAYVKQRSSAGSSRGKANGTSPEHCAERLFKLHLGTAASATCSLSKQDFEHRDTGKQARDQFKRDLRAAKSFAVCPSS